MASWNLIELEVLYNVLGWVAFVSCMVHQFLPSTTFELHKKKLIPVAANDVAFLIHAVLLTAFTLFQIVIYDAVLNFWRKSTVGFRIGNILLDFGGGVNSHCQMVVQSIYQNSWVNFYGNIGKTMISLVSIFFDVLFMVQHYLLYRSKKTAKSNVVSKVPFLNDNHHFDNTV